MLLLESLFNDVIALMSVGWVFKLDGGSLVVFGNLITAVSRVRSSPRSDTLYLMHDCGLTQRVCR